MAEGIKTPPKFDGLNFPIWKVKMTVFLQSLGSRDAKAVTKPFSAPTGDESTWSEIDVGPKAIFPVILMITKHI